MTNRAIAPLHAAGVAVTLLLGSDAAVRAQEPLDAAALYRPVREATVPRDVADAGYFQPLYRPPATQALLDRVFEFEIFEQPLDLFFADLERATGIRFVIDEAGLEEAAMTADAEMSGRSAGMPLGVALEILLWDVDLACVANDDYVLVTSRDSAEYEIQTRLYALVDHPLLRGADADPWWLGQVIRQHAESGDLRGNEPCHVSLLPGAVAVTGTRRFQERAESLLRQYARLLAEYEATGLPASDDRDDVEPPKTPDVVTVVRTTKPSGADAGFRRLTPGPRTEAFLGGPADFKVVRKPLEQLLAEVESDLGVRFEFGPTVIETEETPMQEQVTFDAKGLTYATALSSILRGYDLKIVPQDDRILIVSDDVELPLEMRQYEAADHPLLRGDLGTTFARELEAHLAQGDWGLPDDRLVELCDGVLRLQADAGTLGRGESILRQYARLLAEFDTNDSSPEQDPTRDPAASAEGEPRSPFCFRCMGERPWTELALQQPAKIDVVDLPLEKIVRQVGLAIGAPCLLNESGHWTMPRSRPTPS